ncbi:MAG: GNAT family N-acetyltransferase [Chloroflexota bacterium]
MMSLSVKASLGLNQQQLANIRQLETACNQFENLRMKLNWNTLHDRPVNKINDFFCYNDDQVIGYLALFAFNNKEVEISGMVHPWYRQQGAFRQLLKSALVEIQTRRIPNLLFICERASESGQATLSNIGAAYSFSEYKMALNHQASWPTFDLLGVQLHPAQPEHINFLAELDSTCFNISFEQTKAWLVKRMLDANRTIWLAKVAGEYVGKIQISLGSEISIHAFCVVPEKRGQGVGKAILQQIVTELKLNHPTKQVVLEVESANEKALQLYKHFGFEISTTYDYYQLATENL